MSASTHAEVPRQPSFRGDTLAPAVFALSSPMLMLGPGIGEKALKMASDGGLEFVVLRCLTVLFGVPMGGRGGGGEAARSATRSGTVSLSPLASVIALGMFGCGGE